MNNENDIPTASPALAFCHPNARNSGAAVRFFIHPATDGSEGAVRMQIAKQATVGDLGAENPSDRLATFDWAGADAVRLSVVEAAEMLMVFGGQASVLTHAGKDGLFHNCPASTKSVQLKRSEDPMRPGFLLGVGVTPKADPCARRYHSFCFWPAEAFALRAALLAKFGELAFGA